MMLKFEQSQLGSKNISVSMGVRQGWLGWNEQKICDSVDAFFLCMVSIG